MKLALSARHFEFVRSSSSDFISVNLVVWCDVGIGRCVVVWRTVGAVVCVRAGGGFAWGGGGGGRIG